MDGVVEEALKQVPALVVLAWIVFVFLKHLRSLQKDSNQSKDILIDVIKENSETLGRVGEILSTHSKAIQGCLYKSGGLKES